jgi:hypothetical protein
MSAPSIRHGAFFMGELRDLNKFIQNCVTYGISRQLLQVRVVNTKTQLTFTR